MHSEKAMYFVLFISLETVVSQSCYSYSYYFLFQMNTYFHDIFVMLGNLLYILIFKKHYFKIAYVLTLYQE